MIIWFAFGILVLIIGIVFLIIAPSTKKFYEVDSIYPKLNVCTTENNKTIYIEATELIKDNNLEDWETDNVDFELPNSKLYPLMTSDTIYYDNIDKCPNIWKALNNINNIKNIGIFYIDRTKNPKTNQGSKQISNNFLRCYYPLIISDQNHNLSGVLVDGAVKYFKKNEWIVFDNSKYNSVFNNTDPDDICILLVVDMVRPSNIPKGISNKNSSIFQ